MRRQVSVSVVQLSNDRAHLLSVVALPFPPSNEIDFQFIVPGRINNLPRSRLNPPSSSVNTDQTTVSTQYKRGRGDVLTRL